MRMNIRRFMRITLLVMVLTPILTSMYMSLVTGQEEGTDYLKVGDWVRYSFKGTEAYIPYDGGNYFINITDISDPDNILIDIIKAASDDIYDPANEVLNKSVSAGYYVLNNYTLNYNWSVCPLHNQTASSIKEHWREPYLSNTTGYYNEVERKIVRLEYNETKQYTENKDYYNLSVRWEWDLRTGVLLNLSIYFNNLNRTYLSGYFEQALADTSIFELTAGGMIPGYVVDWVVLSTGAGLIITYFIKIKREGRLKEVGGL